MSMESVNKIRHDWAISDAIRDEGLVTPENIKRFNDIVYGPYKENVLDVYCLKDNIDLLPTIVSIHGGGWVYGDKELYQHYCMALAGRGFTVVNFTYRLAPENKYPAQLEDIFKVFKWIKENHDKYFIDINNLFAVGDSAGGQLLQQSACILTNKEYQKLFDFEVVDIKLNAIALNCGVYVLPVSRLLPPNDKTMTKDYLPDNYQDYLPQFKVNRNITKDYPPTYIMSACEDFLSFMAKPLYRRLQRIGVESKCKIYGEKGNKQIGHVFHLDHRLDEAKICNDEECDFFREHLVC